MLFSFVTGPAVSLFRKLPFSVLYELFYQSGRALGITAYQVDGAAGRFVGPIFDQSVIKLYLRTGAMSADIAEIFSRFFAERGGGTFYDIGANIGMITVPVAKDPRVRCVAFEPDPGNFALLQMNVVENSTHGNVELHNVALADKAGSLRFAHSKYNCGDHRLSPDGTIFVEATRLDDRLPAPSPLAVKIDTQGAEPLIFQGGETFLAAADLIVCEFWPGGMRRMQQTPEPVMRFVARHFQKGQVLGHDEQLGTPLPIADVLTKLQAVIDDPDQERYVDLVLQK
jgi:FkbM family methyltransferase